MDVPQDRKDHYMNGAMLKTSELTPKQLSAVPSIGIGSDFWGGIAIGLDAATAWDTGFGC